jgi:hypothetical protein
LFAGVASQRAIGEASAIYLCSPLAAQRIRQTLPHSRLIAILRQPAERAYSNYTFMRQHNIEPEPSFEAALAQEEARSQAGWYPGIYYQKNGYYHAQLSVYYALFPREQIKVVLTEDLRDSPQALLRDLFRFWRWTRISRRRFDGATSRSCRKTGGCIVWQPIPRGSNNSRRFCPRLCGASPSLLYDALMPDSILRRPSRSIPNFAPA